MYKEGRAIGHWEWEKVALGDQLNYVAEYNHVVFHKEDGPLVKLKFLDISFRTAYAQAKELAVAQSEVPLLTAGTVQVEQRSGKEFAYRYRYASHRRGQSEARKGCLAGCRAHARGGLPVN
jgi:hypothetical protein